MTEQPNIPSDSEKPAAAQSASAGAKPFDLDAAKRIFSRLGPMGPLAIVAASLPALGGFLLLGTMGWSGAWLRHHEGVGIGVFIVGFSVLAGLALLPTYAQSVLAGWAFGFATGSVSAMIGITGASLIGYLIARWAGGDRAIVMINEQPKWKAVYDALIGSSPGRALLTVTLLRIPHNSPFAITNLVMAGCRVPAWIYMVGTVIGIAPRTLLAVYLGARAQTSDFAVPKDRWLYIASVVAILVVVTIIGAIANQAVKRVTAGMSSGDGPSCGGSQG
jgi:uncharacterized membrane protein YdjX (TVP38/TMEM64 family)